MAKEREGKMTQRIFDIENEKDMVDLWEILPEEIYEIRKGYGDSEEDNTFFFKKGNASTFLFNINWHGATKITRPVNYEDMIGCVCKFSTCPIRIGGSFIGVLDNIDKDSPSKFHVKGGGWFEYCEPAKKSELKFWGE